MNGVWSPRRAALASLLAVFLAACPGGGGDEPCPAGFVPGQAGGCVDVDECASAPPCGRFATACTNTLGSYACTCLDGFAAPASGGSCEDVDACALGSDDCDPLAACVDGVGDFTCLCPTGFDGPGRGLDGCLLADPALASLGATAGALEPAFAADVASYTLVLPLGSSRVALTAAVAHPEHATIDVDGVALASGAVAEPITVGDAPRAVRVTVSTDGGASRTTTITLVPRRESYLKPSDNAVASRFGTTVAMSADGTRVAVGAPSRGRVYVFVRAGVSWIQEVRLTPSHPADDGFLFGASIAISADGATLAVGDALAPSAATGVDGDESDVSAPGAGAVHVYRRHGATWSREAWLKASNAAAGDAFGGAVALSGDGSVLAVGAVHEASSAAGVGGDQGDGLVDSGAVYVFRRGAAGWSQAAYLKASNPGFRDLFGSSLALTPDGALLAVGAVWEASGAGGIDGDQGDDSRVEAGAVYVFHATTASWLQEAYLKAAHPNGGELGSALAWSADARTLAISAIQDGSTAHGVDGDEAAFGAYFSGAVYLFDRDDGGTWSQAAYLKAEVPDAGDGFGAGLALSGDGALLAVGAASEASGDAGLGASALDNGVAGAGAVYLFARVAGAWSQTLYLKGPHPRVQEHFGGSLALSTDGAALAIGADGDDSGATAVDGPHDDEDAPDSGAVYVE